MNPIAFGFGFVILSFSVYYVAYPLISAGSRKRAAGRDDRRQAAGRIDPEKQRQAVLTALRDLEFDYRTGKVAEEDFAALRAELVSEAARLIENQERQKDDVIEAMIRARRNQPATTPATPKAQGAKTCASCQATLDDDAQFCSKCGAPAVAFPCPKCGKSVQPSDHFCPSCGSPLTAANPSTGMKESYV